MREAILSAALREFRRAGYEGASVNAIATRSRVNKRMLYVYFGNKLGLYRAVLQRGYAELRRAEMGISLSDEPRAALREVIAAISGWCTRNPEMIAWFGDDHGAFSDWCYQDSPAVAKIVEVLTRGEAQGVFHAGASAPELYLTIVSYAAAHKITRNGGKHYLEDLLLTYLATPRPRSLQLQSELREFI